MPVSLRIGITCGEIIETSPIEMSSLVPNVHRGRWGALLFGTFMRDPVKMRTLLLAFIFVSSSAFGQQGSAVSANDALARLMHGNRRYARHKEQHPDESLARRKELIGGQHPFAVILGCADSRVPPELLFDQGLGDLFVIRVAGNIVDDVVLGSIEYAFEHLDTKLIMVLAHEKCGAVSVAVQGGSAPGHLTTLVQAIQPS